MIIPLYKIATTTWTLRRYDLAGTCTAQHRYKLPGVGSWVTRHRCCGLPMPEHSRLLSVMDTRIRLSVAEGHIQDTSFLER